MEKGGFSTAAGRLALVAIAFALVVWMWLGVYGVRTSNFTFAVSAVQTVPLLIVLLAVYLAAGIVVLLVTAPLARRSFGSSHVERRLLHGSTAVTLWAALVLTFLPLKGSEAFVKTGGLSTLKLNALAGAAILVGGWLAAWLVAWACSRCLSALRARLPARGMRILGAGLLVAVAAVTIVSSVRGRRQFSPPEGMPQAQGPIHRVAIIGVDGCEWDKLGPLVESGRLPNFRRLMESGSYGPLRSLEPLISPQIWTSMATGKGPDKHGIEDFVNEQGVPVNASMRSAETLWNMASRGGATVGVVGWYVTWPAERVNGFLLSDRVHSLLRGPTQIAQSMTGRPTNQRLESFGAFSFDPSYKSFPESDLRYQQNRIVDEPLRWGYLRDAIYARLSDTLLPLYSPDLSAVYLRGVDFVQHFFWQYSDPEPFGGVPEPYLEAYGDVIDNYYVYSDRLLGGLLDALGDDVNILIVSDHGFQPRLDADPRRPQLTGAHDLDGVLIASGPDIRRSGRFTGATVLDIAPTALALMGLPTAEDMDGRVLMEIITEDHLRAYPPSVIPTYERDGETEPGEVGSTMDESIRDQLRSLGYIE